MSCEEKMYIMIGIFAFPFIVVPILLFIEEKINK
jgi:hypothetical protein